MDGNDEKQSNTSDTADTSIDSAKATGDDEQKESNSCDHEMSIDDFRYVDIDIYIYNDGTKLLIK